MKEVWKRIEGEGLEEYSSLYEVSNLGEIRNYNTKHILSQSINNKGYHTVGLYSKGKCKTVLVHRIVAICFIFNDNPSTKIEVNHKDENKDNNTIYNLEWCEPKYNANYGTRNEKIGDKLRGRTRSKEAIEKSVKGRRGYKHSEETKSKISNTQKGGAKNPNSKKVMCENHLFNSVSECAEFYGINYHTLKNWLDGKRTMRKDFVDKNLQYARDLD